MKSLTYQELKQVAPTLQSHETPSKNYQYAPMFLPTDVSAKKGTGVIKVVTRQGFMDSSITNWVLFNSTRAATFVLAAVTLILLPINLFLAGVSALGAGYFYGKYKFYSFFAIQEPRHRWLLEGT